MMLVLLCTLLLTCVIAQQCRLNGVLVDTLYEGSGLGTYYYDAFGGLCSHETQQYPENNGIASCESYAPGPNQIPIKEHKNNNLIAIDNTLLEQPGGREKYCGKRIIVRHNGELINETFIVWDGCGACLNGARLDFSREALMKINPNACTLGLVPGISWKVVDERVMPFVA